MMMFRTCAEDKRTRGEMGARSNLADFVVENFI
jgi:hypothetical protein